MNYEFLLATIILVLIPGTGVIYTISIGLALGARPSIVAALGCTMGIIPALLASMLGLAAIMHSSAILFELLKYAGAAYLCFLAFSMWRNVSKFQIDKNTKRISNFHIIRRAILINALNPKLTLFFLAFLPQFIATDTHSPTLDFILLSSVFMLATLVIFIGYGIFASKMRHYIIHSERIMRYIQRGFAAIIASLAAKLALTE